MKPTDLFTFLLCVFSMQGFSQTDSLELSKNALRKCDSLIEAQKYLRARDWHYQAMAYYPNPIRLKRKDKTGYRHLLYNEKARELNYLIQTHVGDEEYYAYYMAMTREYLDSNLTRQSIIFLRSAMSYKYDTVVVKEILNEYIQSVATNRDSLYLVDRLLLTNDQFNDPLTDLSEVPENWIDPFNRRKSSIWIQEQSDLSPLYWRKDSTLFSGIIVIPDNQSRGSSSAFGFHYYHFKNGKMSADTLFLAQQFFYYQSEMDTQNQVKLINWPIKYGYRGNYYLSEIMTDFGRKKIKYYPNGSILSEFDGNAENYTEVQYFMNSRDTSRFKTLTTTDSIRYHAKYFDKSGQKDAELIEVMDLQRKKSWSLEYTLDENSDTMLLERFVNFQREGRWIQTVYDSNEKLEILYANDTLIDILSEPILFLNEEMEQITKKEFLLEYAATWQMGLMHYSTIGYQINGMLYHWVYYPDYMYYFGSFSHSKMYKKFLRKLRRMED